VADLRGLGSLLVAALALCVAASASAQTVVDSSFSTFATVPLPSAIAGHFDETTHSIIVGTRDTSPDRIYSVNPLSGLVRLIASPEHVAGIVVDSDGDIFFSEDFAGIIYRIAAGTKNPVQWVTGFQAGDDDPTGLAIAPPGHSSGVVQPGFALEVDRGNNGPDMVWSWSPATAEGEQLVLADEGTLIDGFDIAISDTDVWVADARGAGAGALFRLQPTGSPVQLTTSIALPHPVGVAVDPATGLLFVVDADLDSVLSVNPNTGATAVVVSGLPNPSWAGIDFVADGSRFAVSHANGVSVFARCAATFPGAADCNANGITDICEIRSGTELDCNGNEIPDACDVASGNSADCDDNGVPDECPDCAPVELVFIMDTSSSMDDDASALCSQINGVVAQLSAQNIEVTAHIFGISAAPGGVYSCLSNTVISLLGTVVPGAPPPNLATLGNCPGGNEVPSEDWGRATAVVAGNFPWQSGATRVIVPISDEGAWCGDPSDANDTASIAHAVSVATAQGVIVSPIVASGAPAAVVTQAQNLASGTGGLHFLSAAGATNIADGILDLVLDACLSSVVDCNGNGVADDCELASGLATDCNGNATIDGCEIAAHPSLDCNHNSIPDSCDLDSGTSSDCDENAIPDECPACPTLDLVFVVDTSASMDDEAAALCANLANILAELASQGIAVDATLLGITADPGGAYGCLDGTVISTYGSAVPGTPPASLATLGQCPGGIEVGSEDWGRAVAVVAGLHDWNPDAVRVVVPISDEGPYCGDPASNPGLDKDAVDLASAVASANHVIVSPLLGTGTPAAVSSLASLLASQTGGTVSSTVNAAADVGASIVGLVQAACVSAADCDANGVPDACEAGPGAAADCDGNGTPDSCDIAAGAPDLDDDGVLDACAPPSLACAWPCCNARSAAGCADAQIQACVCAQRPDCCTQAWNEACVYLATAECALVCPEVPACCGDPKAAPGCGSDACEGCACATDAFCCSTAWDADCTALAHQSCASACRCGEETSPLCQGVVGDLNGSGDVNVADALCGLVASLWIASSAGAAPKPQCLQGVAQKVDISCNCAIDVTDVMISVHLPLTGAIPDALDANDDGCADLCQ
jgi:hypothetical protein